MIFNGIEKDYIRVIADLFRPPSPPIMFDTFNMSKSGTRVRKKKLMDANLPVPIRISSNQRIESLKEDMSTWLIHDEPKKLIFKDNPNRYYLAYYEGMELSERPKYAKGYINFYLPQAYRFGLEKIINVTSQPSVHTISGQVEVPWTIEVVFTKATNTLEIEGSNNFYLLLAYEFVVGDRLTLKLDGRKALLNGEDLRHSYRMISNFVHLQPGQFTVQASHNCSLKYDERYY